MYVLAVDIGYSNLKVAFGEPGAMKTVTRPATAGPEDRLPYRAEGAMGGLDPILVMVDGKSWAACVEPGRLQGVNREVHEDYTESDSYKALYHAALSMAEADTIDMLVTGLPVHQAKDRAMVERVGKLFVGKHAITEGRTIEVKKVKVVAQPAGAFADLVHTTEHFEVIKNGRVVVVDPGFFSVDYIAVERGELRQHVSGTSLKAMLSLLEETNIRIKRQLGNGPGAERLEDAVQNGRDTVYVAGREVSIAEYIAQAETQIAKEALVQMRKDMRTEGENVDMLLLAGGGSKHYEKAAREIYPDCAHVIVAEQPHLANVRGYFRMASGA